MDFNLYHLRNNMNDLVEWFLEQNDVVLLFVSEGVYLDFYEEHYLIKPMPLDSLIPLYAISHNPFNPQRSERVYDTEYVVDRLLKLREIKKIEDDRISYYLTNGELPSDFGTNPIGFDVDLWNYIRGR